MKITKLPVCPGSVGLAIGPLNIVKHPGELWIGPVGLFYTRNFWGIEVANGTFYGKAGV